MEYEYTQAKHEKYHLMNFSVLKKERKKKVNTNMQADGEYCSNTAM